MAGKDKPVGAMADNVPSTPPRALFATLDSDDHQGKGSPIKVDGTSEAVLASSATANLIQGARWPEKLVAPRFPGPYQIATFKSTWIDALVAASVYNDRAEIAWFNEIDTKSFDELADLGGERFARPDAMMAKATFATLPRDLKLDVQQKKQEAVKNNRFITGRQYIKMIYEWLNTGNNSLTSIYGMSDLLEIKWQGDNNMRDFLLEVDNIFENFEQAELLTDKVKRDILWKCIKSSYALAEDAAHYELLPDRRQGLATRASTPDLNPPCTLFGPHLLFTY